MGTSITTKDTPGTETAKFSLNATTKVFTDDGREVEPGSGEIGVVANGGLVPIGYYKDPEKSARTFREVNGTRYSFPGDMATIAADGTLVLFGRGSNCINTGGEKVYPEEVEEALKVHPAVEDALVFGVPDDRFGQRVVGIVSLSPGESAAPTTIVDRCPQSPRQLQAPEGTVRRGRGAAGTQRQGQLSGRPRALRVHPTAGRDLGQRHWFGRRDGRPHRSCRRWARRRRHGWCILGRRRRVTPCRPSARHQPLDSSPAHPHVPAQAQPGGAHPRDPVGAPGLAVDVPDHRRQLGVLSAAGTVGLALTQS